MVSADLGRSLAPQRLQDSRPLTTHSLGGAHHLLCLKLQALSSAWGQSCPSAPAHPHRGVASHQSSPLVPHGHLSKQCSHFKRRRVGRDPGTGASTGQLCPSGDVEWCLETFLVSHSGWGRQDTPLSAMPASGSPAPRSILGSVKHLGIQPHLSSNSSFLWGVRFCFSYSYFLKNWYVPPPHSLQRQGGRRTEQHRPGEGLFLEGLPAQGRTAETTGGRPSGACSAALGGSKPVRWRREQGRPSPRQSSHAKGCPAPHVLLHSDVNMQPPPDPAGLWGEANLKH